MKGSVRASVESHLGSYDVARVLYGTIVGLALVLALQGQHPAGQTARFIFAAALVVGGAELFSNVISARARMHAQVGRRGMLELARESAGVVVGAGFPALFFLAAAFGWVEINTAYKLAKWSGLGLICAYAFLAAKMAGSSHRHAAGHALIAGLIGMALIQMKAGVGP